MFEGIVIIQYYPTMSFNNDQKINSTIRQFDRKQIFIQGQAYLEKLFLYRLVDKIFRKLAMRLSPIYKFFPLALALCKLQPFPENISLKCNL